MFAENHWVVDGNGFEEHGISVFNGRRSEDDQTWVMGVDGLHTLAVERTGTGSATAGETNGDGAGNIGSPVESGGVIDDLIEADGGEVGELHFDNGAHPFDGGSDGAPDHGVFADGGIENATGKFLGEIFCGFESSTERADILAVDVDARIFGECASLGGTNGFEVSDHAAWEASLRCREARAHQSSSLGSGAGSRRVVATASSISAWACSARSLMDAGEAQPWVRR